MVKDWMPPAALEALDSLDLKIHVRSVPEIDILLAKTVLFRGKKFRPALCFLMGQLFQIPLERLKPYARAAEFVHAATLAHDDVIDESPKRRNRPTLHVLSSNARAVLSGDLLLARTMFELSAIGNQKINHDLSHTMEELVHGEWLQLEARQIISVSRIHLETVAQKKTASLMVWCCATAARLADHSEQLVRSASQFGEVLGVAFQMIDDIIDYDTTGEKPFAHDIREGLVNFVTLELLEENPQLRDPIEKLLGQGDLSESELPWSIKELKVACDRVRARAQAKLEAADQTLNHLISIVEVYDPSALQALRSILVYLRERLR